MKTGLTAKGMSRHADPRFIDPWIISEKIKHETSNEHPM
jgi:hypothetical protein